MDDDAGAFKARGQCQDMGLRGGPADRAAAANYVAELTAELASLARRHGLDALSYILDMAKLEAENVSRHSNARQ